MVDQALAAWQPATGRPLEIGPISVPQPGPGEILVRNRAVAINPVDWILQDSAIFPWLDYPAVLGSDVAGEVAAIGEGIRRFRVGDRVLGQSVGATTNQAAQGAFQEFTVVLENMASPVLARRPAACSRRTTWGCVIRRRRDSETGKRSSSGARRPASDATRSSLRRQRDMSAS